MPAGNGGSVTLNIQAQITGYEQSIKRMKQALEQVDPGTAMGKNLKKGLDAAEKQLKNLMKNATPDASSSAQIQKIVSDVNKLGEVLANLGVQAQSITGKDLKLDTLGDEVQDLILKLNTANTKLSTAMDTGIKQFVNDTDELKKSFLKILNLDVTDASPEEIFEKLQHASEEATKEVNKTTKALQAAEKAQQAAEKTLGEKQKKKEDIGISIDALKGKAEQYNKVFDGVYQNMLTNITNYIGDDKGDFGEQLLNKFFSGLTPQNVNDRVSDLIKSINANLKDGQWSLTRSTFKEKFLGIAKNQKFFDKKSILSEIQTAIQEIKDEISNSQIGSRQAVQSIDLIDKGQIDKGIEKAKTELKIAENKAIHDVNDSRKKVADATKNTQEKGKAVYDAKNKQIDIFHIEGKLEQQIEILKDHNEDLQRQVDELKQQLSAKLTEAATGIKEEMGGAGKGAQALQISREEANKYEDALEKVKGAEQALGRLKGVVQQWFSVYAAVRMVTKAIRNIINTLTSLDKVITEIAIVTNMTQSELWGQMNSYAKMAQTYAASIEGVYQVSQLYYQQGLQTADVMALTEQTLKMACISGLGYAEATDYMTNAVRAFNMEMTDAQRVVDVYSAVAASSATNTTELAEAMSKTASSAQAVGSSFENTTAMMAVMIESTRESAQNIGSSLKSIISRYGEMKADPSALVDSEGQEMSLNKVDKALQSVGISIHDAAGQFRDFDDVIMELAASWDTIDRNTQRYIATIMAGNRQQSRFLALVSGYDRLKELSEEAANSENASQLQYLKTLDSIQAKTQQIKTSFQELYVNSGLEKFYKNLLDYGNQLVQTFTRMPKVFNLPIPALAKFGSMFYTLAKIVKTVFKGISGVIIAEEKKFSLLVKAANNEILTEDEAAKVKRLTNKSEEYKELQRITEEGEAGLTEAVKEGNANRVNTDELSAEDRKNAKAKVNRGKVGSIVGTALSTAGMGLTLAAAGIDETKSLANRSKKAWETGIGSALSGIGTGVATGTMIGGVPGAIVGAAAGLFSGLPGIIEAIGLATESTEEKLTRLSSAIEDSSNTALQSQNELKTLTDYKEKYDELRKSRNKDAESQAEWIKLNNEIAANYPELIAYLDAEGNYVVNMAESYERLAKAKAEVYRKDFINATRAEAEGLSDADYFLTKFYSTSTILGNQPTITSRILEGASGASLDDAENTEIKIIKEIISEYKGDLASIQADDFSRLSNNEIAAIFKANSVSQLPGGTFHSNLGAPYTELPHDYIEIIKLFYQMAVDGKALDEAKDEIIKLYPDFESAIQTFDSDIYDYMQAAVSGLTYEDELLKKLYERKNQEYLSILSTITGLDYNDIQFDVLSERANQAWEDFKADYIQNAANGVEGFIKIGEKTASGEIWSEADIYDVFLSTILNPTWFKNQLENEVTYLSGQAENAFYQVMGQYSRSQLLDNKTFKNFDEDIQKVILDSYDKKFSDAEARFRTNMAEAYARAELDDGSENGINDYLDIFTENIGADFLENIGAIYTSILDNDKLTKTQKTTRIGYLNSIIAKASQLTEQQRITFFAKLVEADLTSISGIYTFLDDLTESGIEIDENGLRTAILNFGDTLSTNLITEFDMLSDALVKNMSDFEKALSNAAKGMDLSTATEMAHKLGITLSNFRFENGKYFYDDVEQLESAYLKENEAVIESLNKQKESLEQITGKMVKWAKSSLDEKKPLLDLLTETTATRWFSDNIEDRINYLKEVFHVSTDEEAASIIQYYDDYYQAWADEGAEGSFYEYVISQLDDSIKNYEEVRDNYAKYQVNSFLIQNGKITDFYNSVLSDLSLRNTTEDINQAILSGDFSSLFSDTYAAIQPYIPELYKVLSSYAGNAFKNVIETISNGKSFYGTASSEEEKALLESLGAEFYDGMNYVIQSSGKDLDFYAKILKQAYDEGKITLQEYNSYYTQFADAIAGENIGDAFIAVAKDYEHISADAANKLATSLGDDVENIGLIYHDLTKDYSINIEEFLAKAQEQYENGSITAEDYNEILKTIDEYDRKNAPETILKNIVDNRTKLTEADIESIAKLLDEDYNVVKEHLQQNADGTYTANFAYLYSIMDAAGYEYNAAIEESLAKQYDDIIEQAIGIVSTQTKGYTKVADMKQFETQLANNGIDFGDSTLYEWDTDIHAFVLSAEGIKKQWELINKEIEGVDKNSDEYYYYTRLVNDTTRQLAENVYSQIANLISNDTATRAQATNQFKKAIDNYNAWLGAQIEGWEGIDSQLALSTIQGGGISAVAMAKTFAGLAGIQLSDSDIQELYRGRVAPLMDAIEQVTATAGEIVSKTAADIIRNAGGDVHEIAGTGQYVVNTAANVVEAYHAIYEELVASGEATLGELNALKAKELESGYKVTELGYLSSAAEMSYEEFGQVLELMGVRLTEEVFDTLGENITRLSNGKLRINNFEGLARALGIDITSDAYISAFKAYNDSMINLNKQTEKAIAEEVNAIGSADLGDKINVTTLFKKLTLKQLALLNKELFKWGANITDGILDIGENANLAGVINTIYNAVKGTDLMLEKDVEALADALDSVLKAFAEGLQKGITGTLTNVEAYDLQTTAHNMFGIDLDFTKTADGLKISAEQATTLYYRLKEVDSFSARLVFDGLKDSLTETGKACESMTSTLAEIHKLEEQLSKGPDNAEVRERLNLYREIASVQMMNDPDQYSFMDNKLPDMLQGPENYWNAWDKAFKSMREAAKDGYIGTQDFYNLVNEMSNVAKLSGESIMFMGEELDGSLEAASALIQKGFGALKVIKGKGAQIDLSEAGLNITGIDDMVSMTDDQIEAVAQANIDMLDSMIQMLEVVVAMEDLGDAIDKDKDTELELDELFTPWLDGEYKADTETQRWAAEILRQAQYNDDLKNALETFYIGEQSLGDIIEKLANPDSTFTVDEANQYQKILQAFYDAYLNGDYDLENLQQSIIDIFSKEFGDVDTIQVGDRKFAIGYGVTLEPNEDGEYTTTPDNAKFTNVKEALQHQALLDAEILAENIGEYDTETEITTGKKVLKDGSSVTIEVGDQGIKYTVPGLPNKKFDSYDDAMSAWYAHEQSTFGEDKVGTREEWAEQKGWTIPITTEISNNTEDPIYSLLVEGEKDITINLIKGTIDPIIQKVLDLLGGGTPTPTPTPTTPTPSNGTNPTRKTKEKVHAVADDAGAGVKNKGGSQNTTDTSSFDAANAALTTLTTTASNLAAAINLIPDNSARVSTLANAMTQLPTGIAERVSALANAINRIPERRTIEAIMRFRVEAQGANVQGSLEQLRIFKSGNVALKSGRQKTLMGELGPELVVSKGRYFVVGQNGAEMVDLEPDAVVFNHLQTKKLLANGKAGRGKAVTNERRATSMATGNASGPAMASAKAALAALKQLRAMWQSLLGASLSDLGALGGSGGGGGGGGGGKDDPTKNNAGFIADLERWYNLLRQIAKLEKDITYEETLRSALWKGATNYGKSYYDSLTKSLDALSQTAAKQAELSQLQKSYYDRRRQDLENSRFSSIFTFDENGLMQYNDNATMRNGDRGGLFALSKLNERNADGSSKLSAKQQFELLKEWGFENEMKYDSQGKEIVYDKDSKNADDYYTKAVQAFWDKADTWKDELDGLFDSYTDALKASQEAVQKTLAIYKELDDAQIELENTVLDALVAMREKEIKDLQDVADAFSEASDRYIEGLNKQLEREQQMYQNNKNEQDLEKNRRRLAVLQRSGASASEIASLQNTIDDQSKQMYFDKQQQQIDAIQEASDAQLEKMNEQIELMQTSLDYEKSNGLLWADVKEIMSGTESEIKNFIQTNSPEFQGLSDKEWEIHSEELAGEIQTVLSYLKDPKQQPIDRLWQGLVSDKKFENATDAEKEAAYKAFEEEYRNSGDYLKAAKAAEAALQGKTSDQVEKEKENKEAAQKAKDKYFANEDDVRAKWTEDLNISDDVFNNYLSSAKSEYQKAYEQALNKGLTEKEAQQAAEDAIRNVLVQGERQTVVGNIFNKPNAFRKRISKEVYGDDSKIKQDDEFWVDVLEDVKDVFETNYLETGDANKAYEAAAKEYKEQKRIKNAEEYWESWIKKVKKGKKENQKNMAKVLTSTNSIGVQSTEKAKKAFIDAFKGKDKKKKRANARAAARSVLLNAYKSKSYSQGGIVDYTGIANVHGTRTKPEAFLNADEVKMWRSDILGDHSGSLTSSLLDLNELVHNMVTGNDVIHETTNNGVSIENAVVNMNTTIANDYDAKRAGELALQQMLKIAQKTGNQGLSRR